MVVDLNDPIFAIDSVAKTFWGRHVLRSASVWVYPGRKTVLIGRNGCGKSTLLRVGTGAIRGTRGVVRCGTWRSTRPRMAELARRGVFLWPDHGLLPLTARVRDLLATVRHHVPDAPIDTAIDMCGVAGLRDHRAHRLSGGERRRVELAIVMARRPAVLLADEPFLGVMPRDQESFLRAFEWLTNRGSGILMTGHEVDTLFGVADDVIWMTGGTTHHLGDPVSARNHDQFRREYLGPTHARPIQP